MKIAIVGSRTFAANESNYHKLEDFIWSIFKRENIEQIISGGASGADTLGMWFARKNNLPLKEIRADWTKGRGAGILRNGDIVNAADIVISCWDLRSRGSKDTINKALMASKPVLILPVKPTPSTESIQSGA
jgi:hypothetical protein